MAAVHAVRAYREMTAELSRNSRFEVRRNCLASFAAVHRDRFEAVFMQKTANTSTEARPQLLTVRETMALTTLGRTSLWKLAKDGRFPRPVKLCNGTRVAFFENEVLEWLANRPRALGEDSPGAHQAGARRRA
jgi:predicted DNA-binding transcriptional regulator AlpA